MTRALISALDEGGDDEGEAAAAAMVEHIDRHSSSEEGMLEAVQRFIDVFGLDAMLDVLLDACGAQYHDVAHHLHVCTHM